MTRIGTRGGFDPGLSGHVAGPVYMGGHALYLDADEDMYFDTATDDVLKLVGGELRLPDDKSLGFGDLGTPDVRIVWDTAETTDILKVGLPSGGGGLVVGPVGDLGVDRYGASPPGFGLWARGDDAIALNRIGLYMDSTHGYLHCTKYKLILKAGTVSYLSLDSTDGMVVGLTALRKVAFWGATPVIQQSHIVDPTGGATVDTEARATCASLNALCATLGLTAAA